MDALESDPESDHEAEITEFLAQHMEREHSPQNGVAREAARAVPHNSLTLSPVTVQQPAQRRAFNLSEALTAGLSGLEGSITESRITETQGSSGYYYELNPRMPVAAQLQARHTVPLALIYPHKAESPRVAGADATDTRQLQCDSYELDQRDCI